MKKFFMVTPQQPGPSEGHPEGQLKTQTYEPVGNSLLEYGPTRFPLIPLLNGYTEPGEEVEVYTVTYDSPDCRYNLNSLERELAELSEKKGISIKLESVDVPFDDSTEAVLRIFQQLVNRTADGDTLHACITFGSKPMPLALVMALQYAYRLKDDVSIDCVVYGQVDHSTEPPWPSRIYDVTSLVKLDEIIRLLADRGVPDPESVISEILAL